MHDMYSSGISVAQSVLWALDAFASVVSFKEIEMMSMLNREFKSMSLDLWTARSKYLRSRTLDEDFSTFAGIVSMETLLAEIAHRELSNVMKISIEFGNAEHVKCILEGVLMAERAKKESTPFLGQLQKFGPNEAPEDSASWVHFSIDHSRSEEQNAIILPMLLNVEKQDDLKDLLLRGAFGISGNCIVKSAKLGKPRTVQILLQHARKANILKEVLLDADGMCLHVAVQHKCLEVVLQILDAAGSVGVVHNLLLSKTRSGETCLSEAVAYQQVKIVQALLEHARAAGVLDSMLLIRATNDSSCLHLAVFRYNREIFTALLEAARGEEDDVLPSLLSAKSFDGRTCLFDAVASVNVEAVQAIIAASRVAERGLLHDLLLAAPLTGLSFSGMSGLHYLVSCRAELEATPGLSSSMETIVVDLLNAAEEEGALSRLLSMKSERHGRTCFMDCLLSQNKKLLSILLRSAALPASSQALMFEWLGATEGEREGREGEGEGEGRESEGEGSESEGSESEGSESEGSESDGEGV